jgi:hypothetical protein
MGPSSLEQSPSERHLADQRHKLGVMPGSLPRQAAWRHLGARDGVEVTFVSELDGGLCFAGVTSAVEDGRAWALSYTILVDPRSWATRIARLSTQSEAGEHALELSTDGVGNWRVDSRPAPHLCGCLDVDLESSALTNAFPAHRLELPVGKGADAPAAYIRAEDLRVERLEQRYVRLEDQDTGRRFAYAAPAFDFTCVLAYDDSGLVLDYPGIAVRAA